jgi:hypothetical protein
MKRIAVETMQRFEAAAVGIDQATPQFQGQSTVLRPRVDDLTPTPGSDLWLNQVNLANGVDGRWQALTGLTDTSSASVHRTGVLDDGGFSGSGGAAVGGGIGAVAGLVGGRGTFGGNPDRAGGVGGARPLPTGASSVVPQASTSTPGMTGPIGAPMTGAGMAGGQIGAQPHRRRVPFDGDDPFDTGEKASKPVIGL